MDDIVLARLCAFAIVHEEKEGDNLSAAVLELADLDLEWMV